MAYKLKDHLCRFCKFCSADDKSVPAELFEIKAEAPDLSGFRYPLPSKKSDYTCFSECDGVIWYGASNGVTRYDEAAERYEDKVMFFSADRDLPDNNVKAILAKENGAWVLTETGATFIEMRLISMKEKADILLNETLEYVERRGMVSQRRLNVARDYESRQPYAHSDNDGSFTAGFAVGEILRYAHLKKVKGADDPETIAAKKSATKVVEGCLLLLHVHFRGNGFVARTYHTPDEPVPDDGIFFRIKGDKAYCVETTDSVNKNIVGLEVDASGEVPERLARLYTDLGFTKEGIVYKADTSSDEITHHFLTIYFAHEYLGCDDPELDELIISSTKGLMNHIIDNGYNLIDYTGKPTTWAKWSESYFNEDFGYVDACLNASELLAYHLVTMHVTGEQGKWRESYDYLVKERGYADLGAKHFDRLYLASLSMNFDYVEDIMYGDHNLAVSSFLLLCLLEKDEELLEKYRNGFRSWRTSLEREHNPGYDIPFMLACPDDYVDLDALATWFYRTNASRLSSGVSLKSRHDIPVKKLRMGTEEISLLLPPDERFISKYDRNPLDRRDEDSGGVYCIESCYVYTFAYWIGVFFGFFE